MPDKDVLERAAKRSREQAARGQRTISAPKSALRDGVRRQGA